MTAGLTTARKAATLLSKKQGNNGHRSTPGRRGAEIPRRPLLSDLGWKPCRWCQEPAPGGAATCTCTRAAYERHRSRSRRNVKDLFWIEFGSMAERLGFGLSEAVARLMQVADDKENATPPKFAGRAKAWVAERVSDSGIDDEDLRKWILDDFPEENAPEEGMLAE